MDLIKLEFPLSVLLDLGFPGRKKIQTLQALRPHMFIHRFFVYIYGNLYATKTGFRITATHPTTKLLAILQWHPVPCYFMFFLFFLWPLPLVNLLQDCQLHLRLAATRLEKFRFQAIMAPSSVSARGDISSGQRSSSSGSCGITLVFLAWFGLKYLTSECKSFIHFIHSYHIHIILFRYVNLPATAKNRKNTHRRDLVYKILQNHTWLYHMISYA